MHLYTKAYSKDAVRVMSGDKVVGMILRLTNDRWAACGLDERRLSKATFARPGAAFAASMAAYTELLEQAQ